MVSKKAGPRELNMAAKDTNTRIGTKLENLIGDVDSENALREINEGNQL